MATKRQKAIRRRNLFLCACGAVLLAAIAVIVLIVVLIIGALDGDNKDDVSSTPRELTDSIISASPLIPETGEVPEGTDLDPTFTRLLLVNAENPLPEDYSYGENLTQIPSKYHNGQLDEINAEVWPYMQAMLEAAWADGVELYVWSPYRSYETQNMLFTNQVNRVGGDEEAAATVVARPGTSEHHTGLCADFNMASDSFAETPMYTWMQQNAEDYGFILRYPESAIDKTGVIYESWHWRFVGIDAAHDINRLGLTLEEYIEEKGLEPQGELN